MAATILSLQIIGWQAVAPNRFIDDANNVWLLSKHNGAMQDIFDAILTSAIQVTDNQAMGSHLGAGLGDGTDLTTFHRFRNQRTRREEHSQVALLNTIAVGAMWPQERLFKAGLTDTPTCQRCNAADDTDLHWIWECPDNQTIDDPAARRTDHYKHEAANNFEQTAYLY